MSLLKVLWPVARLFTKKVFNRILPDQLQLHLTYIGYTGKVLNLDRPERFTEKMQAIKLSPLIRKQQPLTDKWEVREFVTSRIGAEHLIPVYRIFERPEDIHRELLPESFVMKCTHDSGSVSICRDLRSFDVDAMIQQMKRSYERDYFHLHREYNYFGIHRRVICEQFLEGPDGKPPKDYKFFCFNGEPEFIQVDLDRFGSHNRVMYGTGWTKTDFNINFPLSEAEVDRPAELEQMLAIARKLSKGFPFIRVDLYCCHDKVWFGELTFIHGAGYELFEPDEYDLHFGRMIDLHGYFR